MSDSAPGGSRQERQRRNQWINRRFPLDLVGMSQPGAANSQGRPGCHPDERDSGRGIEMDLGGGRGSSAPPPRDQRRGIEMDLGRPGL
jgi:hypothetical protein